MRKVLLGVVVILVIAAGVGGLLWFRQRQADEPVGQVLRSGQIVRGDLQLAVSASGNLTVNDRTEITIRIPGRVTAIHTAQNARVESGDVLAQMDTGDLQLAVKRAELALAQVQLALQMAQAPTDEEEVHLAEIALNSAARALEVARLGKETARIDGEAMVIQAQRQRENTATELRDTTDWAKQDRLRTALEDAEAQERIARLNATLLNEQAASQWQAALVRYEQAKRRLETLSAAPDQDEIRQRELQVEQAELQLSQAQRALDDSTIVAPYDGVIAGVFIEPGTYQRAGARAFTLIDDATYYVDVTIDEIDIGAISVGQEADVVLDAYPRTTLVGAVARIAPASTNLGGLVSYAVRLDVSQADGIRLLDGMTASVSVRTQRVENVLLVPNWAVRIDQEAAQAYTYRLVDGLPVRAAIVLGQRNDTYSELLAGLSEGDEIALVTEKRDLIPEGSLFGN